MKTISFQGPCINFDNAIKLRTPTGATCKGVLKLEATFIDVKNIHVSLIRLQVSGILFKCSDYTKLHITMALQVAPVEVQT